MKVTYVYPPLFKSFYPMATRLITENLLRNKNLQVEFSDIPVRAYSSKIHETLYEDIMSHVVSEFSPNVQAFLQQKYISNILFYVFMAHGYFNGHILNDFDSRTMVMTCINFHDLIIVKHLLENHKKVVLGGPLVNIGLSPRFIRDFLYRMGIDSQRLNGDLIIVSGNIDLTTDLHQLIRNWRDVTIGQNDYGTLYGCERDFLQGYYDDSSLIPVHFGFNNRCWYGKCKFCTYKKLPTMNFLTHVEDDQVINYVHRIMTKFNSTHLRFIDSYYHINTQSVQNILSHIDSYDITIYTGITLLKRKEYIDFINQHVNCLLIGLESTSDFSLSYIDKGYTYHDIETAVDNLIKYLDRKVFLEISIILDLPCKDAADVEANYRNIEAIQQRLLDEGFNVGIHMNILNVVPNLELLYGKKGSLKRSDDCTEMNVSSGKNYLISLLKQTGMDNPSLLPAKTFMMDRYHSDPLYYGYISPDFPIVRYDIYGKVLPSDLDLVDESVMRNILMRRRKKLQ